MSGSATMNALKVMQSNLSLPEEEAFVKQFGVSSQSIAFSSTHSEIFVKKLLAIAISNVLYLRAIMPENSFHDRYLGDLHLKVIRKGKGSHPVAEKIVNYIKGCFDAVERRYLKTVTLWFHEDREKPEIVKEAYVIAFEYAEDGANLTLTRSGSSSSEVISELQTGVGNIKEATVHFLKNLMEIVENLDPLPTKIYLKMQLTYHDDRTPSTYEPKGFRPATTRISFPKPLDIGSVSTKHHSMKLTLHASQEEEEKAETEVAKVEELALGDNYWKAVGRTLGLDESPSKKQRSTPI